MKSPPKSVRLSQIQSLQAKFEQAISFGNLRQLVSTIVHAKIKSFAAQAKALDIADLRKHNPSKRQALVVCLLYRIQVKTRDHLVEMLLKRVAKLHSCAKNKLVELREQHLRQTESMLGVLTEILHTSTTETDAVNLGECVQSVLTDHGGAAALLGQCEEITAYKAR